MISKNELKRAYKLFELLNIDLRPISINKSTDLPSSKYRNAHDKLFIASNMSLSLPECSFKFYSNNVSSPRLQYIFQQIPPDLFNVKFSKETLQKIKTFNSFYNTHIEDTPYLHLYSISLYLYELHRPFQIEDGKISYTPYYFAKFIQDTKTIFSTNIYSKAEIKYCFNIINEYRTTKK